MKNRLLKSRLNFPLLATLALVSPPKLHAAALTWDTVAGDGTTVTAGSGTWDTTAGNIVWNNAGTDVPWSQTSSTAATNTAIFGGANGTYAVTVAADIATGTIQFTNTGYTLSAAAVQTIRLNNSSGTAPSLVFNSGASASIGANVIVQQQGTAFFGSALGVAGGTLNINSGGIYQQAGANTWALAGIGSTVNVNSGGTLRMIATGGGAFVIGANTGDSSTVVVNGGTLSLAGSSTQFLLGSGTGVLSGTLTIKSGGTVSQASNTSRALVLGSQADNTGIVNLDGGTLTVRQVAQGAGTAAFNFNGGTLKAVSSASAGTFMTGLNSAKVMTGGAVIDTNNFDLTIGQALTHDATLGSTADGGLTKTNTGTLTLTGASTYTGKTTINGGTLALGAAGTINSTSEVSLGTAGVFDVSAKGSGGYSVARLTGSGNVIGTLSVSTELAIGNSPGTAGFSNLTLESGSTFTFETVGGATGAGSADLGNVSGTLTLSGATLDLVQLGTFTEGQVFTLFSYTALTGTFGGFADGDVFTDAGGLWQIAYDGIAGTNGGTGSKFVTVTAVPEAGSALLGGLGMLFLLRRIRK